MYDHRLLLCHVSSVYDHRIYLAVSHLCKAIGFCWGMFPLCTDIECIRLCPIHVRPWLSSWRVSSLYGHIIYLVVYDIFIKAISLCHGVLFTRTVPPLSCLSTSRTPLLQRTGTACGMISTTRYLLMKKTKCWRYAFSLRHSRQTLWCDHKPTSLTCTLSHIHIVYLLESLRVCDMVVVTNIYYFQTNKEKASYLLGNSRQKNNAYFI